MKLTIFLIATFVASELFNKGLYWSANILIVVACWEVGFGAWIEGVYGGWKDFLLRFHRKDFSREVCCLAAKVVLADGMSDPRKLAVAEAACRLGEFLSPTDFRRYCSDLRRYCSDPSAISRDQPTGYYFELEPHLSLRLRRLILRYLLTIAEADGEISRAERRFIKELAAKWDVEFPDDTLPYELPSDPEQPADKASIQQRIGRS